MAAAWHNRGLAKYKLGQYEAALEDFNQAIRLDRKLTAAWNNRGNAKYKLGQYEAAIKDYSEVIQLDAKYSVAWKNRSIAKKALGQHQAAIEDYNQSLHLNEQRQNELKKLQKNNSPTEKQLLFSSYQQVTNQMEQLKINTPPQNLIIENKNNLFQKSPSLLKIEENQPLSCQVIQYDELKLGKKLGSGGFGIVYHAQWHFDDVAVKKLKTDAFSEKDLKEFQEEVNFLVKLNHTHIVAVGYGTCVLPPRG